MCEIRLSQEKGQHPPCRWDLYHARGTGTHTALPKSPFQAGTDAALQDKTSCPGSKWAEGTLNQFHHESRVGTLSCKIQGASQRGQFHRLWWMEPHLTHASGEAQQGKTLSTISSPQQTTSTICPVLSVSNSNSFCIHAAPRAPGGRTAVSGRSLAERPVAMLTAALLCVTLPREGARNRLKTQRHLRKPPRCKPTANLEDSRGLTLLP